MGLNKWGQIVLCLQFIRISCNFTINNDSINGVQSNSLFVNDQITESLSD